MRVSNRRRAVAAVVAGIALVLAGCSGDGGDDSAEGPIELTAWGAQTTTEATKAAIAAFEEESGIKINLEIVPDSFDENVVTRWTAGQRPDILFGQPLRGSLLKLNPAKNLQDLSDMEFVDKLKFGLEDAGALDGVNYTATYGFPALFGLFQNTKVLEDNGIQPPTTLDELQDALDKLKAAGQPGIAITAGDAWTTQLPFFVRLSDAIADGLVEDINTGEAEWTDERVVEALEWVKGLVDGGYTNPDYTTAVFADAAKKLEAGEVAFAAQGTWMFPAFTDTTNVAFTAFPSESGAALWQSSNLVSIQLPRTGESPREAAAREFVDFITVGNGYSVYLDVAKEPSVYEGVDDPADLSESQKQAVAAFENSVPSIDTQSAASTGDLPGSLGELLAGTADAAQVAERLQTAFADNAAQAGVPGF